MNDGQEKSGVYFVYDGECPICKYAAISTRIQKQFGSLSTLDARSNADDPLIKEINRRGLDLDEGMVIYVNGNFYHGQDALKFMAKYGEIKNSFMIAVKGLFWSNTLSKLFYPLVRGCRNWLLRRRNINMIDNLARKQDATFKHIFGDAWEDLPPVFKKHYGIRPYSSDSMKVKGVLNVYCKPPLLWLAPIMWLMGQIPTFNQNNVPVTVYFESDINSKAFHFNRVFYFPNGKTYTFRSRMVQIDKNEVAEIMKFGLTWKMNISWHGEQVKLAHRGYAINFFGLLIPIPFTLLMGSGNATEYAINDNEFGMEVNITHPLWGNLYGYKGKFEVTP